ncbi:MAG: hypothetical protein K5848_04720 [Lachnospiraceae bacterium]|nr:hypothetical protein [Lachnospiraceae bacterium]
MDEKMNKLLTAPASEGAVSEYENRLAEEKREKKKKLVKIGIVMLLALLVFVFATIAWFASNKNTEANGMSVTVTSLPFDIATTGTLIHNEPQLTSVRSEYTEGEQESLSGETGVVGTYYAAADNDSLMLRFEPTEADDPETPDVDERYLPDIGPDSSGELSLYIIPKQSGTLDAYIDLNVVSFKAVDNEGQEELIEITPSLDTTSGLTAEQVASCKDAAQFLKGHILFFEELSSVPESYSYKKPITDGKIHFHKANAVEGRAYKVNIYWTWTNTLGQIALKNNDNELRSGIPVVEETDDMGTESDPTDKAAILKYLKDNKDSVFSDINVYETLTDAEKEAYDAMTAEEQAEYESAAVDDWIENAGTVKNFELLSDAYNSADFTIGTNLDYFMIELAVNSTEQG